MTDDISKKSPKVLISDSDEDAKHAHQNILDLGMIRKFWFDIRKVLVGLCGISNLVI